MRHHCKVNIIKGYALDGRAWPATLSDACKTCQGCECGLGQVSMSSTVGIYIAHSQGGTNLSWSCPGCGKEVTEDTTALAADDAAAAVGDNRLCFYCRKKEPTP